MQKFRKLVSIDQVALTEKGIQALQDVAESIVLAQDLPSDEDDILQRIGDADAVLLSANSRLTGKVMAQAPKLRYVGMCCSLYSEESANVDIPYARAHGIEVRGIRDYGDHGVVEYVIYQLVKLLHGYEGRRWKTLPTEITGLKVGFVGLGTSGGMTADALHFLGADISYFARAEKPERTAQGYHFKELRKLLTESEVIITALNKNVILLHEEEFAALGSGKIMFNTSIGPAADMEPLQKWMENPENIFCCDTKGALGDIADEVLSYPNAYCMNASAGMTQQAYELLSQKVLHNMKDYLEQKEGEQQRKNALPVHAPAGEGR